MAPTGITMILSHDDWSLVTEKYSRDELRVVMRSRLASPDLDREYVIGEVTTKEPRVLNYLVRAMRSRPRTFRVELVDVVRGRGELRATFTMEVKLRGGILERLLSLGAYYCVENISEGRERWDVLLDSAKVREVVPTIRTVAEELRVFRREFDPLLSAKGRLTSREEEVLRLAVRRGYFEWPREVGLAELASELGVTRTAVLQILRKAMKKVAESYAEAF